jgi:hypothetical protein
MLTPAWFLYEQGEKKARHENADDGSTRQADNTLSTSSDTAMVRKVGAATAREGWDALTGCGCGFMTVSSSRARAVTR